MTPAGPSRLDEIDRAAGDRGFVMNSASEVGALLAVLAASKSRGRLLELGTGLGRGTSWLLAGMDADARLTSVELDPELSTAAGTLIGADDRLELIIEDGARFLERAAGPFDLIFADTWPGKLTALDRALDLLAEGGFYVADDMDGPSPGAEIPGVPADVIAAIPGQLAALRSRFRQRDDMTVCELAAGGGILLATRRFPLEDTAGASAP